MILYDILQEFIGGVMPLPSPPPTPPATASAPTLEELTDVPFADDTLENCPNTFDRWKIRLGIICFFGYKHF